MADGAGFQDAEIKPAVSTNQSSEKPKQSFGPAETTQTDALSKDQAIQASTEPSEAEKQEKIEKIDQELGKISGTKAIESPIVPNPEVPTTVTSTEQKIKKPNALVEKTRLLNLLYKTNVIGRENLKNIPQGKKIIFVTTHNNDSDVGLVISSLGKSYPDITVVEESTHYNFRQDPISYLGRLIGRENSFRVDYNNGSENRRGKFDPKNFEPMKKSLEEGKPLVTSAYFTPNYPETANGLPERTGNGAAYLAQITKDAIIVPIAVDIKLDKPVLKKSDNNNLYIQRLLKGRINADVIIGKPFTPDHIEKIERLGELLKKRKLKTEPLTKEEQQEFSYLRKQLQEQSRIIMQQLAELLPPEKRGIWGKKEEQVPSA